MVMAYRKKDKSERSCGAEKYFVDGGVGVWVTKKY